MSPVKSVALGKTVTPLRSRTVRNGRYEIVKESVDTNHRRKTLENRTDTPTWALLDQRSVCNRVEEEFDRLGRGHVDFT